MAPVTTSHRRSAATLAVMAASSPLLVRRYCDGDLAAVLSLHERALQDVGAHAGHGPWDDDLQSIAAVYLDGGGEFLVGELDGTLVAMGALRRIGPPRGEVKRMRVEPAYQRRGFGESLFGAWCDVRASPAWRSTDRCANSYGAWRSWRTKRELGSAVSVSVEAFASRERRRSDRRAWWRLEWRRGNLVVSRVTVRRPVRASAHPGDRLVSGCRDVGRRRQTRLSATRR